VDDLHLAPVHLRWQSAWGVARAGSELARNGRLVSGEQLNADYHRLSQAEREKLARAQQTQ
jgi:tRNA threonylcarbamoyladenosine biosynthesis protein TsaB